MKVQRLNRGYFKKSLDNTLLDTIFVSMELFRKRDFGKSGIYIIRNTVNNKIYIGKAKCIYSRILNHITLLRSKNKNENRTHIGKIRSLRLARDAVLRGRRAHRRETRHDRPQ
jgi:predicted GIY-YIG superfamily endonuclease